LTSIRACFPSGGLEAQNVRASLILCRQRNTKGSFCNRREASDRALRLVQYMYVSATVLSIYDHLLLFDDEVKVQTPPPFRSLTRLRLTFKVRYFWKVRQPWSLSHCSCDVYRADRQTVFCPYFLVRPPAASLSFPRVLNAQCGCAWLVVSWPGHWISVLASLLYHIGSGWPRCTLSTKCP
jgi:hypothetical protein